MLESDHEEDDFVPKSMHLEGNPPELLTKRRSLGNEQIQAAVNSLLVPQPKKNNARRLSRGSTDAFQQTGGKMMGISVLSTKMHVQKLLNNVMSKNHLKELLQKPYKSPTDAEFILRRIERMKFFQSFMTEFLNADYTLLIDFCSHLRHEWHPQGTVIIKQGDFSCDKMYVILTGTVSVYRKDQFAIVDMNSLEEKKSGKSPMKKKKEISELENAHGTYIKDLVKEEGFGERALLQKIRRMATIVAKTDVDFLVINKEDFQKIKATFSKAHELRVQQIIYSLPVLKSKIVSSNILDHLMFFFEEEKITRSQMITKQGEKPPGAEKIYIIHYGEFLIEKEIEERDLRSMEFKILSTEEIVLNKTELPPCKPLKIAVVGKGMVIGEEIVMPGHKGLSLYSIRCVTQEATVLSLQKSILYSKFPKFLVDFLRELHVTRHKQRNQFYEDFLKNMILNKNLMTPVLQHGPTLKKKIEIDEGLTLDIVRGLAFRKNMEIATSFSPTHSLLKPIAEPPAETNPKNTKIKTQNSNTKNQIPNSSGILKGNDNSLKLGLRPRPQTQSSQLTSSFHDKNFNMNETPKETSYPSKSASNKRGMPQTILKTNEPKMEIPYSKRNIQAPTISQKENKLRTKKKNYIIKFDHKIQPKSINNRSILPEENEEDQGFKRIQKNFIISPKHAFQKLLSGSEMGSEYRLHSPISQPTASSNRKNSYHSDDELMSNAVQNDFAEENVMNDNNIKTNIKRMRDLEIGDEKQMFRQDRYLKAKMIKHGLIKTEDFTPKPQGIKSCGDFLRKLNYQKNPSEFSESVISIRGTPIVSSIDLTNEKHQEPCRQAKEKKLSLNYLPPRQESFTQNLIQKKEMRKKLQGFKTLSFHHSEYHTAQIGGLVIGKSDED